MTNQVNQAFEKWWHCSKYMQVVFSDNRTKRVALDGYEAATQASTQHYERKVVELTNHIDMMLDEFARVRAISQKTNLDAELEAICDRAKDNTYQRVPVIKQRDEAIHSLAESSMEIEDLQADNNRLREALTQLTALKFSTASHIQKLDAVDKIANKALSLTPAQSLVEQDKIEGK